MKVFSWNIRHGGGTRITEILAELERHTDSDFIILTEYRNNKNASSIKEKLTHLGFVNQYSPNVEAKVNSVLIAAKYSVSFEEFPELQSHQHRVVSARWKDTHIVGTYFPQKKEKARVFDFLSDLVKTAHIETTLIIAGDMNTGVHFEDETGKSFYCSKDFIELKKEGLTDAWRLINTENTEYTWYSNHGNGFRIDHFLISSHCNDLVNACYYLHGPRINKISDHSQMILELR